MELLNPLMLWGGLAIAIPIILHFWHQKKGKVLEWAASQWLIEKNLQQSKGIRLDNILLLLLRCLLILLLCFILSKPLINWSDAESARRKIHLVQPNALVLDNYRFELEEAIKKGEKLFWIQPAPLPVEDISQLPPTRDFNPVSFQSCLNKIAQTTDKEHLELYFINDQTLARSGNIFVPNHFTLHTIVDTLHHTPKPYLAFGNSNQKLYVNANNQLITSTELDKNSKYTDKPIQSNTIDVLILNTDKTEKQSIAASLKALQEVYQMDINTDMEVNTAKKYAWVFSNSTPPQSNAFSPSTLYILSNTINLPPNRLLYQKNTINVPFGFSPQTSGLVFNGELPEWLAEIFIKHYVLNPDTYPLSQQQLHNLFKYAVQSKAPEQSEFSKILVLVFIIVLGIERYIAIRKNA